MQIASNSLCLCKYRTEKGSDISFSQPITAPLASHVSAPLYRYTILSHPLWSLTDGWRCTSFRAAVKSICRVYVLLEKLKPQLGRTTAKTATSHRITALMGDSSNDTSCRCVDSSPQWHSSELVCVLVPPPRSAKDTESREAARPNSRGTTVLRRTMGKCEQWTKTTKAPRRIQPLLEQKRLLLLSFVKVGNVEAVSGASSDQLVRSSDRT